MSFFWKLSEQLLNIPPETYKATLFSLFALDVTSHIRFPRYVFGGADNKLAKKKLLSTNGVLPFFFFRLRHYVPYAYLSGLYLLRWFSENDFATDAHVLTVLALDAVTALNAFLLHRGKWALSLGWDGQFLYVQEANAIDDYIMRLSDIKFAGASISMALLAFRLFYFDKKDTIPSIANDSQ